MQYGIVADLLFLFFNTIGIYKVGLLTVGIEIGTRRTDMKITSHCWTNSSIEALGVAPLALSTSPRERVRFQYLSGGRACCVMWVCRLVAIARPIDPRPIQPRRSSFDAVILGRLAGVGIVVLSLGDCKESIKGDSRGSIYIHESSMHRTSVDWASQEPDIQG